MSISLKSLRKRTNESAARIVIYGPEGIGKTTLAAEFPESVFIQVEDGTPSASPSIRSACSPRSSR